MHFAGGAAHRDSYQTVHGACLSGIRAAKEIADGESCTCGEASGFSPPRKRPGATRLEDQRRHPKRHAALSRAGVRGRPPPTMS
ncbi:hypothetical protein [Streptomyces gilvosporeus]|uniref:hypothetical protein n=1 Tax=Streptomyces gilvosporeus TaxID=553510 RepID=UPI003AB07CB5